MLRTAPDLGPVALWVCDRGGGELVGLDRDLYPVRSVRLADPSAVAPAEGRGCWALVGRGLGAPGEGGLVLLDVHGAVRLELGEEALGGPPLAPGHPRDPAPGRAEVLGPSRPLGGVAGDALVVLEHPSARRLVRVRSDGTVERLLERAGLVGAAGAVGVSGARVLAWTRDGELVLLAVGMGTGGGSAVLRVRDLGAPIVDVGVATAAQRWWALTGGASPALRLLDGALDTVWSTPCDVARDACIPEPGAERVWLLDAGGRSLRRTGPGDRGELEVAELPLAGARDGIAWIRGGVLLVAPGAIVHVDGDGRLAPGQGGFRFLAGAADAR